MARNNTTWKKGRSPNPGGRAKKTPDLLEVERLAREASVDAMKKLIGWMDSPDPTTSIKACTAVLDRAWGKPRQAIEHSGSVSCDISSLSDADLAEIIAGTDAKRGLH